MMTDLDARNLIEEELKQKMLGPGYAKDLIQCSEDAHDEIMPENPRYAYSLGVLMPQNAEDANDGNIEENPNLENTQDNDANLPDANDGNIPDKEAGQVETEQTERDYYDSMFAHIGLITCVSLETQEVAMEISYGTYRKLTWEESVNSVRVLTGRFNENLEAAIDSFSRNEALANAIAQQNLPPFNECFIIDQNAGTISISPNMGNPESTLKIPNNEYPVEAGIVNLLLGPHYQRSHHQHSVTVSLQETNGQMQLEDEVKIYWTVFEANNKKFLKILLQSIASKPIYQPEIIVSVLNGTFESYVEPITHLDTDEENNINEFVYRNVRNFGKGVNCAIGWNEDAKKVFTTFTPTVDVEKFSNEIADETINDICTLRNLSIWTTWTDEELIDKLREFVNGYNVWCTQQENTAGEVEGYQREKETILQRQSELLDRLSDNIEYLNDNTEALQCFKIANTAMLLQMVVARHPQFEKNREPRVWDEELDIYGRLDYFENAEYVADTFCEPQYRPFQLAFLLMNVKSTFEQEDPYRTSVVDLIWFPTGGGKTEAYLALTALTIVHRRRRGQYKGVSVIMEQNIGSKQMKG